MRKVHALSWWVLCAAAALAGCGKMDWDWWKPKQPPKGSAQGIKDANLEIGPAEALRLKDENKTLRDQLQDLQLRDQQLSEELKQTKILYEGQLNVTESLKSAPDERDKARAQVKELTAEVERLRQEIARLKGEAPPASQPAPAQPVPAQTEPSLVPPPQVPSPQVSPVLIPPAELQPAQTSPAAPPPSSAPSPG